MAKKPYNGHESWNAWNVSLWIGNDEWLYRLALDCIRRARFKSDRSIYERAARLFIAFIADVGAERTPDGARYSVRSVRLALAGLES